MQYPLVVSKGLLHEYASEVEALAALRKDFKALEKEIAIYTSTSVDLERGLLRFTMLSENTEGTQETYTHYSWPFFGKALRPDVLKVNAVELLNFVKSEPEDFVYRCDDIISREIGFVSYHPQEGIAKIRRAPLHDVKGNQELGAQVTKFSGRMLPKRINTRWVDIIDEK